MICSPESTIAGVLNLSEDKTVHCRLLSNLKVQSNLQDSVVTPTKWTERPLKASYSGVAHGSAGPAMAVPLFPMYCDVTGIEVE